MRIRGEACTLAEVFSLVWLASGAVAASQIDSNSAGFDTKATFRPADRAVTNWRVEAVKNLDLSPQTLANLNATVDFPVVPRCVKLNNYWCVKRAGWSGEIAADAEGHVAFASAQEGAVVAAMLLRRYYLVYHRRSAQSILSHWAPAQCGGVSAGRPLNRSRDSLSPGLALNGIGHTLRARWLAAHKYGVFAVGRITAMRRSVVAERPIRHLPAPEIAVGMGEREAAHAPLTFAALELPPSSAASAGASCLDESLRIHHYALRAIEGIALNPDDDLNLFSPDGTPGTNLSRLMGNMAKVEIGPFAVGADLIAAAIAVEAQREQAAHAAADSAQSAH